MIFLGIISVFLPKINIIEEEIYSLSDLLEELQMVVRSTFDRSYWVIAEIVSVSEAKNGHLYLEIAEKENDFLQAKIRANIWSNSKKRILSEFEHITNQSLKKGMKVLVNVTIDFHTVFGLSLNILDIDPNFSLGEIERQKQATLLQLEQEGLIDFNKQHVLPAVIQSIAIISSATAAGYQDFTKQLSENNFGYTFKSELFQATMQGVTAANSIIQAMDKIEKNSTNFDVVVLIRGGGSSLDLSCFDEYSLAARLAQSHFPVFTGIGHERDTSIADIVAHSKFKTPTAVADYIVTHNRNFENELDTMAESLNKYAFDLLDEQKLIISNLSKFLSYSAQQKMHKNSQRLMRKSHNYQQAVKSQLTKADFRLDKIKLILQHDLNIKLQQIDQKLDQTFKNIIKESKSLLRIHRNKNEQIFQLIHLADPKQILKKGFSITRVNGKLLRSIKDVDSESVLNTELCDGVFESKILQIDPLVK
ncbi:MAG: exodeoxyribonuclease VII large subunit [Bacteroidales bacterium]|jgi:exodeoxyribonuclease VII large subunit|nr:exodeoxyribonuclease VII large subunit [Bacteroidales bacterium]